MSKPIGLDAEASIQGTLLTYTREELQGLGEPTMRTIRRELGKAGLDQDQHIEEVFQDSLLKTFLKCQAVGKPIRNIHAYFITTCRNTARKYMETVIRAQKTEEPWSEAMEGQICLPDEPLVDERSLILAALPKLSPRSRRIIKMMYIDDLDPKEIQDVLGCTDGALRTTKHRALKALREALKELLP